MIKYKSFPPSFPQDSSKTIAYLKNNIERSQLKTHEAVIEPWESSHPTDSFTITSSLDEWRQSLNLLIGAGGAGKNWFSCCSKTDLTMQASQTPPSIATDC